ncbi:unnamed protein product [Dracunculus medinensis]|uniref:PH domain-containing protein n=1 Tax=Dracunculus medinensis TaxID=318479 RepID=A0A0N4UIX5_DRAME|nr:unnamed protein product [Dracunculus medinensis]
MHPNSKTTPPRAQICIQSHQNDLKHEDALFESNVNHRNNLDFHVVASATLKFHDAKPKIGIYAMKISPVANYYGPPLYGHIRCRLVVQPYSILAPLISGFLTVYDNYELSKYPNLHCSLQGGIFRCKDKYSEHDLLKITLNEVGTLFICVDLIINSIEVAVSNHKDINRRQQKYLLISNREKDIAEWMICLKRQIYDLKIWGIFAMTEVKLIDERNYFTSISTIAQAGARKLYDEIQIHGFFTGNLKERHTKRTDIQTLFKDLNTLKESQERSDMRYVTTLHIGYNPETLVNRFQGKYHDSAAGTYLFYPGQ